MDVIRSSSKAKPQQTVSSPPDGPDRRDADGWRLAVMETADCGLEKLLDEFRRHGCSETTGRPQSAAQKERGCS